MASSTGKAAANSAENTPENQETEVNLVTKHTAQELAVKERVAARRIWLGDAEFVLIGTLIIYIVSLFLPYITSVPGWKIVLLHSDAAAVGVKITEYVHSILLFLGVGVFTALTLIFRRTVFALIAWMLCTVAAFYSIWAAWLRQTRPDTEAAYSSGLGFFLAVVCVLICVVVYSRIALRRSTDQKEIAYARAQVQLDDPVAKMQREARTQENSLLIDDRRQRAVARHKKPGTTEPTGTTESPES